VKLRRPLATGAAALIALCLAGCGGDDDPSAARATDHSSGSPSVSASASASSSSSVSPSSAGTASSDASGRELSATEFTGILTDALDKATTAHLTMDLGGVGGTAEGDVDYTQDPPALTMTLSIAQLGGDIDGRFVDGKMYVQTAALGKKWVLVPLDDPQSPLGALGGVFDLDKAIQSFAAAVTSVQDLGQEDRDGDSLEHYAATVDTSKLADLLPSAAAGGASALPDTLTQDWWFDSDGLIREFSFQSGSNPVDFKLSDWGEKVSIDAPPADQVTSMPDLSGTQGS
jgi:LppX/LprAFG-like lipoprotein